MKIARYTLLMFVLALTALNRSVLAESQDRSLLYKLRQLSQLFGPQWIEGKNPPPIDDYSASASYGNGVPVPPPNAEFLPFWLPMCFLFDPRVDAVIANEKVKRMTSAYASCGIVLEPHVATLRQNYSDDPEKLQAAARAACPFTSAFGVRGAIQMELKSSEAAKRMCSDPAATGCSTLCSPLAVSFVAPNSGTSVGLHESMHSNCCGPVCVNSGEGAGIRASADLELAANTWKSAKGSRLHHALKGPGARFSSITPEGCRALRSGASPNKFIQGGSLHWYEPEKQLYVTLEKDPERQLDLTAKKSFLPKRLAGVVPARESVIFPRVTGDDYAVPVQSEPQAAPSQTSVRELASMPPPNRKDGRGRSRGAALRQSGDPTRKFGGGDIGTIDAYSGAESSTPTGTSPPEVPFPPLDTTP